MSNFTVRVELHGVGHDSEKYTELHNAMRRQGFFRTVTLDKVTYDLPTAEYSRVADESIESVLESAKLAALSVMRRETSFSVLVTASENPRAQYNLQRHRD